MVPRPITASSKIASASGPSKPMNTGLSRCHNEGLPKVALTVPTAKPIVYPVAPLVQAPNAAGAARFVHFLFTPPAQAVMAKHGFGKP